MKNFRHVFLSITILLFSINSLAQGIQAGLILTPTSTPAQFLLTDNSTGGNISFFDPGIYNNPSIQILPSPTATITYPANGTYSYQYIVIDSISWSADTVIGTLTVTNSTPCATQASILISAGTNPGQFNLTDNSTNATQCNFNSWDMNGNLFTIPLWSGTSNTVSYFANGTYFYQYVAYDSLGGCSDTILGSVLVSNFPSPCSIQAGLNIVPGSNPGEFILTDNSSGGANFSYFENGFGPSDLVLPYGTATVTYPANGVYTYYYIVTDTNTNCYDTLTGLITVSGIQQNCNASFILLQDTLNPSQYYCWNNSTGSNPTSSLSYFWSFGDGNTSTLAYPMHTYNSLGTVILCLTITENGTTCSSTFCDTLTISVKASGTTLNVLPPGTNLGKTEIEKLNSISIFPNPTDGLFSLSIESANNTEVLVTIASVTGQKIVQEHRKLNSGANQLLFDETELPSGVYLVNVVDQISNDSKIIRLVKN